MSNTQHNPSSPMQAQPDQQPNQPARHQDPMHRDPNKNPAQKATPDLHTGKPEHKGSPGKHDQKR